MTTIGLRSASGITDRKKAMEMADGFAEMYGEDFVVFEYHDPFECDVEPAKPDDDPLKTPFCMYRTKTQPKDPVIVGVRK